MKMTLVLVTFFISLIAQGSEGVAEESFISNEGLFDSGLTSTATTSDYKDPYADSSAGNPFLKSQETSPYLQSVPTERTTELYQNYYTKPDETGALKYYLKNAQ